MQFRQLRHFVTVAEELHMHRAAERLNIAQPALSQQIKSLEERLGVLLFSRAHRRLALTPAGEAFLEKTRMALEMADGAVLDARRTARGELGELNLGYVSSAMFDPKLPRLLRQLQTGGAEIRVSLTTGNVQSLIDDVSGYRIDIAVIRGPVAALPEPLEVRPFVREKIKLALYSQHPLANSAALSLASLKNEKWLSLRDPEGVGFEHSFKDACRIAGIVPQVVQSVGDVPTLISLISAGLGIALVPASAAHIRLDNVVYVDLLDRLEESELVLIYRRIIRSEVVKKFLQLVRASA